MNLRALQLFRQIVLTGALSEASSRLNISVSAASRLLSQLESDVALTLFSRSRRRLELTEDGELFYRQIANTLLGIDEITRVSRDIRQRSKDWLSVVTAAPLANGLAVPGLARLRDRAAAMQCSVKVESRFEIESKVAARGYNLGLISLPVENAIIDLQIIPFLRSRLCVLMRDTHPLATRRAVTVNDLAGETFATLEAGQRWRNRLEEMLGEAGLSLAAPFESSSTLVTIEMVRAGLGIALLDRVCAPPALGSGLVLRPIAGDHWITYASLHPPGARAPLAERFLDAVSDAIEDLRARDPQARDLLELI
ncbi:LysR family transcriptional regulator [Pseudooceanicola sediminis]|uniref:LysR family transcriptional regulator n=1 Tax=Pseudooceanicola sediminis TaxID=2211117 RepID=A0A399J0J2_9RHOB|nr:LysR family transcriptional regulator [Pseudooceanicola sediminis]KAA2316046.1 LysR family transcriptional regulator [Puniceibacterium sp. HSS470]RII38157.1 LysR family transcriptional regulator [Pseudooceanicola sediminis]|tara:strand:+ start:29343 stop:30272 length:930 start_codon:yes stop_codon:yes gene_type:complete